MKRLTATLFDGIVRWAAEILPRRVPRQTAFIVAGSLALLGAALAWYGKGSPVLGAACGAGAGLGIFWLMRGLAARAAAYIDPLGDLRRRLQRARRRGQWAEARLLAEQLLDIKRQAGDQAGMARELAAMGILAQREGDWAEARRLYGQSLDIRRDLGDQPGVAESLGHLAFIASLQGDLEEARRAYEEQLRIAMRLRDEDGVVFGLVHLAMIARAERDDDWAGQLADALLDIGQQLGNQCARWEGLRVLATLAEHQGDYAEARRLAAQSAQAFQRMF